MGLAEDTYTLFLREMLIFKKSIATNFIRALIFPIVFILFLGSAGSTPKNVPVAAVNYDNGLTALNFINQIQAGSSLKVSVSTTQQQAMLLLSQGKVAAVVVIPNGFSSGISSEVYVYLDGTQPQSVGIASSVIDSVAAKFSAHVNLQSTRGAQGAVSVVSNYAYGAASNYESYVVGGIIIMVAAFGSVFGSGFTVLSDRELGNLKAFLTTPINTSAIFLSKIMYGTAQSAFSAYIALGIGLLFGATIAAGLPGFLELLWIILITGLGFSALSVALASRMKQLQTYALIAQTVTLPPSFLGGAFVPVSLLPSALQSTAVVNPVYYAINAVRDIMIRGHLPISAFLMDSGALLVFAIIMTAIAAVLFKNTSEQI